LPVLVSVPVLWSTLASVINTDESTLPSALRNSADVPPVLMNALAVILPLSWIVSWSTAFFLTVKGIPVFETELSMIIPSAVPPSLIILIEAPSI
jgi:hypothetical protein